MQYKYKIHQQETVYDGFFKFNQYQLSFERFDGGFIENVTRECGVKHDIVAVLPYDPVKQVFLMVEQFRIGMSVRGEHPWTMEIVAGFMDVEHEDSLTTAKRELFEETGCHAIDIHPMLNYYPGPGGSAAKIHLFIATIDSEQALHHTGITDEGENICVHKIPLTTIQKNMQDNTINNATSIIAFQQFFLGGWFKQLSG